MSKLSESKKEEIKGMIAEKLFCDIEQITDDLNFVNDLGADSLDEVKLVMEVERMFGISIPDDEAEEVHKVSELYDVVERYIP